MAQAFDEVLPCMSPNQALFSCRRETFLSYNYADCETFGATLLGRKLCGIRGKDTVQRLIVGQLGNGRLVASSLSNHH